MIETLTAVRKKLAIGFVGGSDLVKITEQLQVGSENSQCAWSLFARRFWPCLHAVLDEFDYAFAENGLIAYKLGKQLPSQSFINFLGEERYKKLVNFLLHYIADLDIPIKRYFFYEML